MQPINGLYAVTPELADTAQLVAQVETVLGAGARLLQYRNKAAGAAKRREQAGALAQLCKRYEATFIVNDDVALASVVNADGVHLGHDDAPLKAARAQLGPRKIIGVSCYDELARARQAAEHAADYIAFGSFFASQVKPLAPRAPLALLGKARALGLPMVAIGGITLDNAHELVNAGAHAVAVISALFSAPHPALATRAFCQLFDEAQTHDLPH